MAQAEGEKELVLGNKQLISLFFVVVALCGVFFAMGYMMGRPSAKQVAAVPDTNPVGAESAAPAAQPAETQQSEPPREAEAPVQAQPPAAQPATTDREPQLPPAKAKTETQAARDVPSSPAPAVPPTPPASPGAVVPEPGATYLQVTALRRMDADNLVKTLREQNLPAIVADSSKPDLFRVLVGPYHQTTDVADAKARLKALGFANAFVQK